VAGIAAWRTQRLWWRRENHLLPAALITADFRARVLDPGLRMIVSHGWAYRTGPIRSAMDVVCTSIV